MARHDPSQPPSPRPAGPQPGAARDPGVRGSAVGATPHTGPQARATGTPPEPGSAGGTAGPTGRDPAGAGEPVRMDAGARWAHRAVQRAYRVGGNEEGGAEDELAEDW